MNNGQVYECRLTSDLPVPVVPMIATRGSFGLWRFDMLAT
jgi:hypothetical protein